MAAAASSQYLSEDQHPDLMPTLPSSSSQHNRDPSFESDQRGVVSLDGRSLSLKDEKELLSGRGFTRDTLRALRLFSVTNEDLPLLGITWPYESLPSTIAVPYLGEMQENRCLARLHKMSAQDLLYPPYLATKPRSDDYDIIITESEIKAGIVSQLGDLGVGMQGAQSYHRRIPELANAIRSHLHQGRRVVVALDHEWLVVGSGRAVHESMIDAVRVATGLTFDLGLDVGVLLLPDEYFKDDKTSSGAPKVKADLDGCVASGMSIEKWCQLKAEARSPWEEHRIPTWAVAKGMALADPEELLSGKHIMPRLQELSTDDTIAVCKVVAEALKTRSVDPVNETLNTAKLNMLLKKEKEWAKGNGLRGVTVGMLRDGVASSGEDGELASRVIAHCMEESPRGVLLVKKGVPVELVAPFTLKECSYGRGFYVGGAGQRIYSVIINGTFNGQPTERTVTLHGNLYDVDQYTKADPDLSVASARHFKSYVAHCLQQRGFQRPDPSLDCPFFVGVLQTDSRAIAVPSVVFPRGDRDCVYDGITFPETGDANAAFHEVAAISTFNDVAFAHALGAPLKTFLGAYPHGGWVGHRDTGKTTTETAIIKRTGLKSHGTNEQFSSRFRVVRVLGNHNLPVFLQEAARLDAWKEGDALAGLNSAYNTAVCTHGLDGYYCLAGCAILSGQDRAFSDEAFYTKQVVIGFQKENLNPEAIKRAKAHETPFPFVLWLKHIANTGHLAQDLLNRKQAELTEILERRGIKPNPGDRNLFNYACVLVSAHFLSEFGVWLDLTEKVAELCRLHLAGMLHNNDEHPTARSSAERFLRDFLSAIGVAQHQQALVGAYEIEKGAGVWFKTAPVFEHLKKLNPKSYDQKTSERMGEAISNEFRGRGMKQKKHKFGATRTNGWFIPAELCAELGVEFEEDGGEGDSEDVS